MRRSLLLAVIAAAIAVPVLSCLIYAHVENERHLAELRARRDALTDQAVDVISNAFTGQPTKAPPVSADDPKIVAAAEDFVARMRVLEEKRDAIAKRVYGRPFAALSQPERAAVDSRREAEEAETQTEEPPRPQPISHSQAEAKFRSVSQSLRYVMYDFYLCTRRTQYTSAGEVQKISDRAEALRGPALDLRERCLKARYTTLYDAVSAAADGLTSYRDSLGYVSDFPPGLQSDSKEWESGIAKGMEQLDRAAELLRKAGVHYAPSDADLIERRLLPFHREWYTDGNLGPTVGVSDGPSLHAGADWYGWKVTRVTESTVTFRSPRGTTRTFTHYGQEIRRRR